MSRQVKAAIVIGPIGNGGKGEDVIDRGRQSPKLDLIGSAAQDLRPGSLEIDRRAGVAIEGAGGDGRRTGRGVDRDGGVACRQGNAALKFSVLPALPPKSWKVPPLRVKAGEPATGRGETIVGVLSSVKVPPTFTAMVPLANVPPALRTSVPPLTVVLPE